MNKVRHVAIIMDGNGRWANLRSRPRFWGHIRGTEKVSEIVSCAVNIKLESLTLYAFSTENWERPQSEVNILFRLLHKFLLKERDKIFQNNIKFQVIGSKERLPKSAQSLILELENQTKNNTGLNLSFAFSYGGRFEIISAVNKILSEKKVTYITEDKFSKYLFNPEVKDIDLLIRTGGDFRVSNFLLWQIAYAELYFTETLWPDLSTEEFKEIIENVSKRERRFGKISVK